MGGSVFLARAAFVVYLLAWAGFAALVLARIAGSL